MTRYDTHDDQPSDPLDYLFGDTYEEHVNREFNEAQHYDEPHTDYSSDLPDTWTPDEQRRWPVRLWRTRLRHGVLERIDVDTSRQADAISSK